MIAPTGHNPVTAPIENEIERQAELLYTQGCDLRDGKVRLHPVVSQVLTAANDEHAKAIGIKPPDLPALGRMTIFFSSFGNLTVVEDKSVTIRVEAR